MMLATGPTPRWSLRSRIVASPPSETTRSSSLRNRWANPTRRAISSGTPTPVFADTGMMPTFRVKSLTRSYRSAENPVPTSSSATAYIRASRMRW